VRVITKTRKRAMATRGPFSLAGYTRCGRRRGAVATERGKGLEDRLQRTEDPPSLKLPALLRGIKWWAGR
jgi:hypothetical protein